MSKVPNARFEDATDVIGLVRYVKSAEEIQYVRRSAEVAAAGLEELIKLARPGVDAGVLFRCAGEDVGVAQRILSAGHDIDAIGTSKPKRYTNPRSAEDSKPAR